MRPSLYFIPVVMLLFFGADAFSLTLPEHPEANAQGEFFETRELPAPHVTPRITKNLSLKEAILLALRNNPDVISEELTRVTDKFALEMAYYNFQPQYSLTASDTMSRGAKPEYSVKPGVSLTTPLGTQLSTEYENTLSGGGSTYEFNVTQPLLKNAGMEYNLASLRDALDTEKMAQWTFKSNIITAVDNVVTQYRSLVEDYNNLRVQEQNLKESEKTVDQYKLEVKAGKFAKSDLLQQQASLASNRVSLLQTKSSLSASYQDFLESLGLASDSKVEIEKKITFKKYNLPSLKDAIKLALKNNPSYRSALLSLEVSKRSVMTAQNDSRWELDVTASKIITHADDSSTSDDDSVALSLAIPINDLEAKQELVDAKIALEQARLSLEQEKQQLIRTVTTQYSAVKIGYQEVLVARNAVKLQKKTVEDEKIKLKYGKTTVFELNTLTDSLLDEQLSLIETEIAYMNSVTTFQETLGTTLDRWDVKLRY